MATIASKNLTIKFIADTAKWDKSVQKIKNDMRDIGKAGSAFGKGVNIPGGPGMPKPGGGPGGNSPKSGGGFSNFFGSGGESSALLKGDLSGALIGVAGKFAIATAAALAFYGGMSKVIDIGNQTRDSIVQMQTLLGGSEMKAIGMFNELKKFGATTPLELPEITKAANQLLAVKVAGQDVIPTLSRLGDIAKVSGKNFNELASIYAKNKSSNFIQGEDLNQLIEAGIPVLDEFSKMFGKSAIEVKKMGSENKITFAHLEQAFKNMTSEGGLYFEGMKRMAKEVPGIWSNIQDTWTDIFRAISGADLASNRTSFWSYLKSTLQGFSDKFTAFVEYIRPALVEFGIALGSAFAAIWDVVVAVMDYMKMTLGPILMMTYGGLRAILFIFTKAMQIISFFAKMISTIISTVYEALDLLFDITEKFRSTMIWLENLWVKIVTIFISIGLFISSLFDDLLNGRLDKLAKKIYETIIQPLMQVWDYISNMGGKEKNFGAKNTIPANQVGVDQLSGKTVPFAAPATPSPGQSTSSTSVNSVKSTNSTTNNNFNIKLSKPEEKSVFDIFNQSGRPSYSGAL